MKNIIRGLIVLLIIVVILLIGSICRLFITDGISGNEFTLKLKESVVLKDYDNMKITLNRISDSRCRGDIQCIWQGEITYDLTIVHSGKKEKYRISTELERSITVDKYVIEVIDYDDVKSVKFIIK